MGWESILDGRTVTVNGGQGRDEIRECRADPVSTRAYTGCLTATTQRSTAMPAAPRAETPTLAHLLTITEVADALGVSVRHVRRLVHEKRIPYIKWGHLLRFDPTDLLG